MKMLRIKKKNKNALRVFATQGEHAIRKEHFIPDTNLMGFKVVYIE